MKTLPQSSVSGLHPLVGHAYSSHDCNFLLANETYENGIFKLKLGQPSGLKILISGGSTSDLYYDGSWVRPFSKLVYNQCSQIYSTACVGYSSSQELLRLLESISVLRPDIVISLNGINDFACIQSGASLSPFVHNYLHSLFKVLCSANTSSLGSTATPITERELVFVPSNDDFNTWCANINLMNTLSYVHGSYFFSFLQPCLGYGPYVPPPNSIEDYYLGKLLSDKPWYLDKLTSFFDQAKHSCVDFPFVYDLTSSLGLSCANLFQDVRHLNQLGNHKLARSIYDTIKSSVLPGAK